MTFTAKMVTKLTGLTYRRLDYWDRTHFVKPSMKEATGQGTLRLYSFTDIVQLKVAKTLSDKGVTLQNMRKAITFLKINFPDIEKPLAEMRFITDGEKIFTLTRDGKAILDTLSKGQMVFTFAIGEMVNELKGEIKKITKSNNYKVTVGGHHYKVIMHSSKAGDYVVEYPEFEDCIVRGQTREEALDMVKENIKSYIISRNQKRKKEIAR